MSKPQEVIEQLQPVEGGLEEYEEALKHAGEGGSLAAGRLDEDVPRIWAHDEMKVTPFGAMVGGAIAGVVASAIMNRFFKATGTIKPGIQKNIVQSPGEQQMDEAPTEKIARRWVEGLMRRGPVSYQQKKAGASLAHYAFGAEFGSIFGALRESYPFFKKPSGVFAYSVGVWFVGDMIIVPAFRLAAWPRAFPVSNHLYAIAAHLVYGYSLWGTYEAGKRLPRRLPMARDADLLTSRKNRAA